MIRPLRGIVVAAATALALAVVAMSPLTRVSHAHANGVPTLVRLSYLEGLSNFGPKDASGTLELSLGEGYAKVDAVGLPKLTAQKYQGWLVNSQSNDAVSIGTFSAGAQTTSYKGTLPTVPNFGFDLFLITVEPDPDDAPTPSSQRSIGGHFSLIGQRNPDGTLADPATGGGINGGPRALPNTGDGSLTADLVRVSALIGTLGIAGVAAVRLGRRHA